MNLEYCRSYKMATKMPIESASFDLENAMNKGSMMEEKTEMRKTRKKKSSQLTRPMNILK